MFETLLIVNVVGFVTLVFFLYTRGYFNLYSGLSIYLVFHFLAFVQRPIMVYLFDLKPAFEYMRYYPPQSVLIETLVVANIGLASFVFFYAAALKFAPPRPGFEFIAPQGRDISSFVSAFLLLLPLILYSFYLALTMRQEYGVSALDELGRINMTIDPTTGQQIYQDTTAYVVQARSFAFPFAALLIHASRARWWSFIPIYLCALIVLQVGERWPLVIVSIVSLLLALYAYRRRRFSPTQIVVMLAVLFAFSVVGQNREAIMKLLLTGEINLKFSLLDSSFGRQIDFANYEFLAYIIGKVPDVSQTYSYFTQYLGAFTQPIPRMLWPDKPVGSPVIWVNLEAYGRFSGLTTSLVGDGWMSWGYPGVVITTGLVGAFYGRMFKRFCSPDRSIYFHMSYFWMVALLAQWARDGGWKILHFALFCTGPYVLAYGISYLSRGQARRAPGFSRSRLRDLRIRQPRGR